MFKPKNTTSLNKQKNPELTMEDYTSTKSLVLYGCRLAKDLESNIDDVFNKADEGANLCDQIAKIFGSAAERLRGGQGQRSSSSSSRAVSPIPDQAMHASVDASLHEWLANSSGFVTQGIDANQPVSLQGMDWLVSAARNTINTCSSSTSQRSRRRKDDVETSIVKMAAPQIGNTEIPPDDGYTWRKYGQKEIMGKKYPRGYYRCTHQRQFNCPAKKQVQRDDRDPFTFEVMYRGRHTCHLSSTAPSMLPSQDNMSSHDHAGHQLVPPAYGATTSIASSSTAAAALGSWLSIHAGAGGGPEASAVLELPVVDMADAMFNSGSSSTSNSMDFLFPSAEDHKRSDHVLGNKKMG